MEKLKRIPYIASLVLLAYMPFHIFLSQWLSTLTGGIDVWKIAKDVVLFLFTVFTICLVWWQGRGTKIFNYLVVLTAAYGSLHLILWAVHPDIYKQSAELGVIYNMRLPLSLLLGYGAILLLPKFAFSSVIKITLIVSTIVAALGVVQYFLPSDLLTHFGYSAARGALPAFYIDDNHSLPIRIISTLREPNVLGAFLLLPATALGALLLRVKDTNRRLLFGGALALHLLAILLTYSRSALAGVIVSLALVVWWQYRDWFVRYVRRFWPLLIALVIGFGIGTYTIRNTAFFESYIAHGHAKNSRKTELDSNQLHSYFVKRGLEGIRKEPLGHGPGTAGLASIQNPKGSFLTENYYVQIGYEVGVLGLLLFVALNVWVYLLLMRRSDVWAHILMAGFGAYVLTNMLLHTWSNEAVALQWWLLAGMAIAAAPPSEAKTAKAKRRTRPTSA